MVDTSNKTPDMGVPSSSAYLIIGSSASFDMAADKSSFVVVLRLIIGALSCPLATAPLWVFSRADSLPYLQG